MLAIAAMLRGSAAAMAATAKEGIEDITATACFSGTPVAPDTAHDCERRGGGQGRTDTLAELGRGHRRRNNPAPHHQRHTRATFPELSAAARHRRLDGGMRLDQGSSTHERQPP
jgi:hypothetical protein